MSDFRLRIGGLRAHLPDPSEVAAPRPRDDHAETLRLVPIEPAPARPHVGLPRPCPVPDPRALDALAASIARLADLDALALSLRPDLAAALGSRLPAIRHLTDEVRTWLETRALLSEARLALRQA